MGGTGGSTGSTGSTGWQRVDRARLHAAVGDAPVVVFAAPGGYGKSTLAQQLAEAAGAPVAHLTVAPGTTVDQLAVSVARSIRRAGLSDLAAALAGVDATEALDRLIGVLNERDERVVLVIDDLHLADGAAIDWVRELIAERPAKAMVLVTTRSTDVNLLGRYRGRGVVLGADDLVFTEGEAAELLGRGFDDPVVRELLDASDGWPAALAVAAAALRTDPEWSIERVGGRGAILARLVGDLLGDDIGALRSVTGLPLLSPDVTDLVAGPGSWAVLQRSGIPLVARGDRWWVLPDPIREAVPGAATPPDVTLAVAQRYAGGGELAVACQWLVAQGHVDGLAALLASQRWTALDALGVASVRAFVELLGDAALAAHPGALLNALWYVAQRDNVLRASWARLGERITDPSTRWGRSFRAERCHETSWEGRHREALDECAQLLAVLPHDEAVTRARTLVVAANAQVILGGDGALAQADARLAEAGAIFRATGEARWESDAWLRAGYAVSFHHGRWEQAVERVERAMSLLPEHSRDYALLLTYYSDVLDYAGRTYEGEAAAARAIEIGERIGDDMLTAYGGWAAAWVCAHRGDLVATQHYVEVADRHRARWFVSESGVEYLMIVADMLASLGPDTGWERYLDELRDRIDGNPIWIDANQAITSRVEAMWGDPAVAEEIFDQRETGPYARDHDRWIRLLLRAVAVHRLGRPDAARGFVAQALADLERSGQPDLWRRREVVLVGLLADVWPVSGDAEQAAPAARVEVEVLGRFRVTLDGDEVTPANGNPAMLVKLLAVRGPLHADQAIDELWPDADAATGRARLRNLLNRIRTQSGELIVRDGDALSLADGVELDLARFERMAEQALSGGAMSGAVRLALAAFGGELLPHDAYADWTTAHRERVRRAHLALLDRAADEAVAAGELDEAVRLFELAIEAEPYGEARYVQAIDVLLQQGRVEGARQLARQARSALADLGVVPGPRLTVEPRLRAAG